MVKNLPEGEAVSIPGSVRLLREDNGNPLQYSCLENLMDREALQSTPCGVAKSRTQLSDFPFTQTPNGYFWQTLTHV